MNDDLSPLEPELVDELLSAELDGELDAAARDLGLDVDAVSARLRITPGADDRRTALAAARAALAEAPEIDELVAARLRAKAGRAFDDQTAWRADARRHRRTRMLLSTGGIAAALAAVVAVAAGINASSSTSSKASSAPADAVAQAPEQNKSSTTAVKALPTQTLGAFSDVRALGLAAVAYAGRPKTTTAAGAGTSGQQQSVARDGATASTGAKVPVALPANAAPPSTALAYNTANAPYSDAVHGKSADSLKRLAASCPVPAQVPGGDTLVVRGSATLSGTPVRVLVFVGDGEHIVVVQDATCRLVNLQTMG